MAVKHLKRNLAKWTFDVSEQPTSAYFAAAGIDETADTITIADHPFVTGDLVAVNIKASTGVTATVPALSTAYYIIYVDKNTVALATSLANAKAGTKAALTAGSAADIKLTKNIFGAVKTGIIIPAGAVVVNAWYDVVTTFGSYDGSNTDAATIALSTGVGANDLVSAISIATAGDVWDAGLHGTLAGTPALDGNARTAIAGAAAEAAACIKATSDSEVVFTVAVDPLTAGKIELYVEYLA